MLYNASNELDVRRATTIFKSLLEKGKVFELKERRLKRTIRQNAYLHLILSWFALETGYTADEVKQEIFKKIVNPAMFYEGEHGELVKIERWRSSADLDTEELSLCIERFRDYSAAEAGIYLPEPTDLALLQEIEIKVNNNKMYL